MSRTHKHIALRAIILTVWVLIMALTQSPVVETVEAYTCPNLGYMQVPPGTSDTIFASLPPRCGWSGNDLLNLVDETEGLGVDLFRRRCTGQNQETITKRYRLLRFQSKTQCLLTVAENSLAERISGKQTVAAGVPVGRKSCVLWVIENN